LSYISAASSVWDFGHVLRGRTDTLDQSSPALGAHMLATPAPAAIPPPVTPVQTVRYGGGVWGKTIVSRSTVLSSCYGSIDTGYLYFLEAAKT